MVHTIFNVFLAIGSAWVMWLLIALSVLSLAITFDRWRALGKQEKIGAKLWREQIEGWVTAQTPKNWKAEASQIAANYPCVESRLLQVLATKNDSNTKDLELVADSVLTRERLTLENNMGLLGTLGNNAPFIGLFGTVLGIIRAFADLGNGMDSGGVQAVSGGLAEALVATAVGLFVAIPSVMAYNYFQRKIKKIMGRANSLSSFLQGTK